VPENECLQVFLIDQAVSFVTSLVLTFKNAPLIEHLEWQSWKQGQQKARAISDPVRNAYFLDFLLIAVKPTSGDRGHSQKLK
jgi:hypothetical protein